MDPIAPDSPDSINVIAPPSPQAREGVTQKYIRTYAGDIATVQRGGVPALAPLATVAQPSVVSTPSVATPPAPPITPSEPEARAFPALDHDARVVETPLPTPPDALITTYEQG